MVALVSWLQDNESPPITPRSMWEKPGVNKIQAGPLHNIHLQSAEPQGPSTPNQQPLPQRNVSSFLIPKAALFKSSFR